MHDKQSEQGIYMLTYVNQYYSPNGLVGSVIRIGEVMLTHHLRSAGDPCFVSVLIAS